MKSMNHSLNKLLLLMLALAAGSAGCQAPGFSAPGSIPAPVTIHVGEIPEVNSRQENALPIPPAPKPLSPQAPREDAGGQSEEIIVTGFPETYGPVCLSPSDAFLQDRQDFFPMLARDARGLVNCRNVVLLGGALGGAIAVRHDVDGEVRDYVEEHPKRWGNLSDGLGIMGEAQYQIPVLLGVYGYSVYSSDDELHNLSQAIISAYTLTGLSTLTVKAIANTDRPSDEYNDGNYGFPSFHAASGFSVAAVVEEYEGLGTALPVYALAGMISWSRIDEQDHDLSDVLFGAALGYVIGKSVARQHREKESQMRLVPYSHPLEPATGVTLEMRF
jgi:hypothetical protein